MQPVAVSGIHLLKKLEQLIKSLLGISHPIHNFCALGFGMFF